MAMDMSVALKITAGVTGQQAVEQLRTSMDKLQGAADKVGQGFSLAKTALAGFLGAQAIQGIASLGMSLINAADQLDEMSERTGIAVEKLSALSYSAKLGGTDLDAVQAALGRVAAKAVDAATGNQEAALAFKALGVDVKAADGSMRTSISIMEDIGAALSEITDKTLRSAVAREIFGKNADALLPFLLNLQKTQAEAQTLGIVLSEDFAAQSARFNDNVDRMTAQLRGMGNSILNELLPIMNTLTESWINTSKEGGALKLVSEGIAIAMEAIIVVGGNLVYVFKQIANEAVGIAKQLGALATLDFDAFSRIGEQMRVDAEKARKEIDAWSESILNARKEAAKPLTVASPDGSGNRRAADILKQLEGARRQLTDAEKEAKRVEEQRKQLLEGLNDQVTKLVEGEDALFIAKMRNLGASEKEIAQAQDLLRQQAEIKAQREQADQMTKDQIRLEEQAEEAIKRKNEALRDAAKRVYEETRTPAEKLNIELARLNDLLAQGAIDWDTYERAQNKAQDDFENLKDTGKNAMDELRQAVEGWGRKATDTFVDFIFTGKAGFKDLVNSILQDMARMVIQQQIMAPLMQAASSFFGGFKFANGGIMTSGGPLPLNTYARGGIANSPQLALFGEGRQPEAYVPLPDGRTIPVTMQGGGAGETNVVVNVNMESGQTQAQADGQRGTDLGLVIASVVKQELINQRRPGGLLAAA